MSGGPYGRGKAPERACLKFADWPEDDRLLWRAAIRQSDLLDPEIGARSVHAPKSNYKAEKGYGRWLTFLRLVYSDALQQPPAVRITMERVKAYAQSLRELGNASGTILARLQELGEVAKVMDPGCNWGFINRIASKIRSTHRSARSKAHLKLTDELLELALALFVKAKETSGLAAAILHRDGLLIGVLALLPLRRKNFAALALNRDVIASGDTWLVVIGEQDTKTHRQLELPFPAVLEEALKIYLQLHRPFLARRNGRWAKDIDCQLWISKDGSPMTEIAVYDRIRVRTAEAFGRPLSPHLFRDAAATTLAITDPAHVRIAAPLLGHASFATTEKYYQQATAMSAHREYIATVFGHREKNE